MRLIKTITLVTILAIFLSAGIANAKVKTASFTIAASSKTVVYGQAFNINGTLQGQLNKVVTIQYRTPTSSTYQNLAEVTTNSQGNFTYSYIPQQNYYYKAYFTGDGTYSNSMLVRVKPLVTAKATEGKRLLRGKNKKVPVGKDIVVSGHVTPGISNAQILLQIYKDKLKKYVTFKTTKTDANSNFKFKKFKLSEDKLYKFRVSFASSTNYTSNLSSNFCVIGYYTNSYKVSAAYANYIVIDRKRFLLFYVKYGKTVRYFPVVVGQPGYPTPPGDWRVVSKQENPTWYNPHADWSAGMPESIPPGPGNPLGVRGIYLSASQIIIHGTNQPSLLREKYRAFSHGCIRLENRNIVWLYARIPVGTPVKIL